jgi:hypothetical protein
LGCPSPGTSRSRGGSGRRRRTGVAGRSGRYFRASAVVTCRRARRPSRSWCDTVRRGSVPRLFGRGSIRARHPGRYVAQPARTSSRRS